MIRQMHNSVNWGHKQEIVYSILRAIEIAGCVMMIVFALLFFSSNCSNGIQFSVMSISGIIFCVAGALASYADGYDII